VQKDKIGPQLQKPGSLRSKIERKGSKTNCFRTKEGHTSEPEKRRGFCANGWNTTWVDLYLPVWPRVRSYLGRPLEIGRLRVFGFDTWQSSSELARYWAWGLDSLHGLRQGEASYTRDRSSVVGTSETRWQRHAARRSRSKWCTDLRVVVQCRLPCVVTLRFRESIEPMCNGYLLIMVWALG
jgi:hypothetical protein